MFKALIALTMIGISPLLVAQTANEKLSGTAMLGQVILALLFVIALIFGAAWLMKRFQMLNPGLSRQVKVLESVTLGRKEKLLLVEVQQTKLLLGVGAQSINVLHTLDADSGAENVANGTVDKFVTSEDQHSESNESFSDFLKSILIKEHKK